MADKKEEGRQLAFAHDPGRNSTVSTHNSIIDAQYRKNKLQATKERRNKKRREQRSMQKEKIKQIAEQIVEQHLNEVKGSMGTTGKGPAHRGVRTGYKKTLAWVGDKVENTDWNVDKVRSEASKAGHKKEHVEKAITYHTT